MIPISPAQLTRLQTSWHQYARRTVLAGDERSERLSWAASVIGRSVDSFKDLTMVEGKKLIKAINGALGIPETRRRRISNDQGAHAAGTEGRRGSESTSVTLVSAEDLGDIYDMVSRLGWDENRFNAWLRSQSSPLAKKLGGARVAPSDPTIRTLYQANRVRWALKGMLKRAGKWRA